MSETRKKAASPKASSRNRGKLSGIGGLGSPMPGRKAAVDEEENPTQSGKLNKQAKALQDRLDRIGAKINRGKDEPGKDKKKDKSVSKDKSANPPSISVVPVKAKGKEKEKEKISKEAMEAKVKKFTEETKTKAKKRDMEEKQKAAASAVEREKQLLLESLNPPSPSKQSRPSSQARSVSPASRTRRSSMAPTGEVIASLGIGDDDDSGEGEGLGSGAGNRGGQRVPSNLLAKLSKEKIASHSVMMPEGEEQKDDNAGRSHARSRVEAYDDIETGRARRGGGRGTYQVTYDDDAEGGYYSNSSDEDDVGQARANMVANSLAFRMGQSVSTKLRSTMKNLSSSRFEDWTRQELVMLLVHRGVELRGEAAIASQTLIDMAEEAFSGEPLPDKPRNFTIWELLKLSWAVAKVQDVWIEKIYRRRMERMNKQEFFDDGEGDAPQSYTAMHSLDSSAGDPGAVDNEAALMSVKDHDFIHGHTSEMRRKAGDNSRLGLVAMKHTRKQAIDSHLDKARPVSMITNAMKIPWVGPDWEKARVHADYVNPRKGGKGGKPFSFYHTTTGRHCCLSGVGEQCDIFREGQTSEVGIYGSGVANYFKFIKWIAGLMFTLCIVTLPVVTLNYFGRAYDFEGSKDWRDLSRASLGNLLPDTYLNGTDPSLDHSRVSYYVNGSSIIKVAVPVCRQTEQFAALLEGPDPDLECMLDKASVGKFYMWIDMIVVFVVFVAYLWLKYFEDRAVKRLDSFSVFASMYTVQVKHLPRTCTEQDIRDYIADLIGTTPRFGVTSVNFAYDNEQEIKDCSLRGNYVRQKIRMTSEFRYKVHVLRQKAQDGFRNGEPSPSTIAALGLSSAAGNGNNDWVVDDLEAGVGAGTAAAEGAKGDGKKTKKRELEKGALKRAVVRQIKDQESEFRKKLEEIDKKIASLEGALQTMGEKHDKPILAYVTFNTVAGSEEALRKGKRQKWQHYFTNGCKNTNKKIQSRVPHLKRAPEPSTIIWENLRYSKWECFVRRAFITFAALCVIGISLVFTLTAKYLQDTAAGAAERSTLCPTNWDGMSSDQKWGLVNADKGLTHCYCDEIPYYRRRDDDMCTTYFDDSSRKALVTLAAAFVVVGINAGLGGLMGRYSFFEKHHTEDARMRSAFDRIFLLKYINTSLVFLLNNNRQVLSIFKAWGYTATTTTQFSREWYDSVGITILLVQVGNIPGGHVMKCAQYAWMKLRLWYAKRDPTFAISQDELNKLHEGPSFRFAENYAQLMSVFYATMTFNLGIPLLNWVALVNFLLFYFVDKYFFVHVCQAPAKLNVKLNRRARSLIPGAIFVHLLMGLWTLSNDDIFESGWDQDAKNASVWQLQLLSYDILSHISAKLYQSHMFPIVILIICSVGFKLLLYLHKYLSDIGFFAFVSEFLKCGNETKKDPEVKPEMKKKKRICGVGGGGMSSLFKKLLSDVDDTAGNMNIARAVTYPRAVQRNLIKGLATYNILHNPVYKEQFAITWKFAMKHRRVKSVLLYDSMSGSSYDESLKDADALRAERLRRVSALPEPDKREIDMKKKKEETNKRMLKMMQGRVENSRPQGVALVGPVDGEEGKEDPYPSGLSMSVDGNMAFRRPGTAGPRR